MFHHLGDLPVLDVRAELGLLARYLAVALLLFLPGAIIQAVHGCITVQGQVRLPRDLVAFEHPLLGHLILRLLSSLCALRGIRCCSVCSSGLLSAVQ